MFADPEGSSDVHRVGRKARVAGHPVVEPEAVADDHVRMLNGAVDVHLAMHPRHAEMERMGLGEGADAEQGGDDRDAGARRRCAAPRPGRR
jgi:hypothetical protein